MAQPTGEAESSEASTMTDSEASTVASSGASTMGDSELSDAVNDDRNRRQAALYTLPFLALGVGNAVLILSWGLEPLWAFAQLPPILFVTALTYIVFSTDFLDDR